MPKQRTTKGTDRSQRVTTALMDLATLSLHTSALRFSSPDTLHRPATLLIQQLMTLCEARQGALFFTQPTNDGDGVHLQDLPASPPPVALIASAQMREE